VRREHAYRGVERRIVGRRENVPPRACRHAARYIGTAAGVYDAFHHGKDAAVVAGTRMQLVVGDAFYTGVCRVDIDQR
jgi:hypothetical protein